MSSLAASTWQVILCRGKPTLEIAGHRLSFPSHSAAKWIEAINSEDLEAIMPGLLAKKHWPVWAEIYFDERWSFTTEVHHNMILSIIGAAAGCPAQAALRLIATAAVTWRSFDGWAASRSVNPLTLPLDRFCNLVYHYLTQNAEEKELFRLDAELIRPLPGTPTTAIPEGWDEGTSALTALAAHQSSKGR